MMELSFCAVRDRNPWHKLCLAATGAIISVIVAGLAASARGDENAPTWKGRLFLAHQELDGRTFRGELGFLDLETGRWTRLLDRPTMLARVSPDGRTVVYQVMPGLAGGPKMGLFTLNVARPAEPKLIFEGFAMGFWGPDGQQLLVQSVRTRDQPIPKFWLMDADGTNRHEVNLLDTDRLQDWSRDSTRLLALSGRNKPSSPQGDLLYWPIEVMNFDGTARLTLVEGFSPEFNFTPSSRFTPDGRSVIYQRVDRKTMMSTIWRVDVDGQNRRSLLAPTANDYPGVFCVSPDGKGIAVAFAPTKRPGSGKSDGKPARRSLAIVDADGQNRRLLEAPFDAFQLIGWCPAEP
jgi:Tol biopolymer transport system component